MIWAESLTNPTLKYTDIEAVVKIAKQNKVSFPPPPDWYHCVIQLEIGDETINRLPYRGPSIDVLACNCVVLNSK